MNNEWARDTGYMVSSACRRGYMSSRAWHWLHVFARFALVTWFHARVTVFSRAWHWLHGFPRFTYVHVFTSSSDWLTVCLHYDWFCDYDYENTIEHRDVGKVALLQDNFIRATTLLTWLTSQERPPHTLTNVCLLTPAERSQIRIVWSQPALHTVLWSIHNTLETASTWPDSVMSGVWWGIMFVASHAMHHFLKHRLGWKNNFQCFHFR